MPHVICFCIRIRVDSISALFCEHWFCSDDGPDHSVTHIAVWNFYIAKRVAGTGLPRKTSCAESARQLQMLMVAYYRTIHGCGSAECDFARIVLTHETCPERCGVALILLERWSALLTTAPCFLGWSYRGSEEKIQGVRSGSVATRI